MRTPRATGWTRVTTRVRPTIPPLKMPASSASFSGAWRAIRPPVPFRIDTATPTPVLTWDWVSGSAEGALRSGSSTSGFPWKWSTHWCTARSRIRRQLATLRWSIRSQASARRPSNRAAVMTVRSSVRRSFRPLRRSIGRSSTSLTADPRRFRSSAPIAARGALMQFVRLAH
ncbi:hypothetical protein D3C71_1504630 [compost metagenome]